MLRTNDLKQLIGNGAKNTRMVRMAGRVITEQSSVVVRAAREVPLMPRRGDRLLGGSLGGSDEVTGWNGRDISGYVIDRF